MACHEIAALRLGMMNVIGIEDEGIRQHEISEMGKDNLLKVGPLKSLANAQNLHAMRTFFEATLADLEQKVVKTAADDAHLPYFRTLMVLTKKVELELKNTIGQLENIFHDLEEMHDFVHELYPAPGVDA